MSDVFQDGVDSELVRQVWDVMDKARWHTFQILTKRPERMLEVLSLPQFSSLSNVWLGTSVESEDHLDRIDVLRRVPANVRFVSFEPLLGPIVDPTVARSDCRSGLIKGPLGYCRRRIWSPCTADGSLVGGRIARHVPTTRRGILF